MTVETDERLDLLDALVYGDAFDCAVTLDELWRYARVRVGREALRRLLDEDPLLRSVVVERNGLLCLIGREELLARRPARLAHAATLRRRADRVARVLRHVPFVRGLVLTGSAAAGDAGEDADVDLLVIVEPGRLGTAFALLGTASRLLGRRLFCPNYYVATDDVAIPPGGVYVARELDQARVLVGDPGVLRAANEWLVDVFPNLAAAPPRASRTWSSRPQRALESLFAGRVEAWARRLAATRLLAHYGAHGDTVPADVAASFRDGTALRFHAGGGVEDALARYAAGRAELGEWLARLDSRRTDLRSTA
jgi:predicted nucleotidyltransferase